MLRLQRYLFRMAGMAFLVSLATLTTIIWITGALKEISLLTAKGQTILVFFTLTSLGLPFLVAAIAPIALFGSVLYCLNRLNGDSELIVLSASGVSPGLLLQPFMLLSALVFAGLLALHTVVIPYSFNAVDELSKRIHADFIANFARPGAFNQLEAGFIFHYRERAPDGGLRGVFIQDRRNPQEISTFIAEVGDLVEKNDDVYLVLRKGSAQRPSGAGDSSLVTFQDYAIDLSQFLHRGADDGKPRPRNRDTMALLNFDSRDPAEKPLTNQARTELYERLTSPLYALVAGLIAFAALGQARTTRQNRGLAILVAILMFAAVRIFGFADALMLRGKGAAPPPEWSLIGAWGGPLAAAALSLDAIFAGPVARAAGRLRARR
ncbi:MAG: LPS export ABC transporter permease LptF [Pseudomonadota bacterium]|nr:LPS export ABC transporter permease LptF [Pseudomonadota bacterium]